MTRRDCPTCDGYGVLDGLEPCPLCGGGKTVPAGVHLTDHEVEQLNYVVFATDCNFDDVIEQVELIVARRLAGVV